MTAARKKPAPRVDPETFVLPHNLEAERATLGAALVSRSAADYIADALTRGAYFRRAHQVLYEGIRDLRERRVEVDFVTLKQQMIAVGQLEEVGGAAALSALADGIPRSSNVEYYAGILKDLEVKRSLVHYANATIDNVAEASRSSKELLEDADSRLMELQTGHVTGRMQALRDSAGELARDLEWRVENRGKLSGIETGFDSINGETLGWQRGDLIILAARPSIGKTAFLLNSLRAAAEAPIRDGSRTHRVAIFSLEMKRRQLEYRLLSSMSGVPLSNILRGALGEADLARIADAQCRMAELSIEIDDKSGQTVFDVRASCRRMKAEGGLDVVAIDYIQLMAGSGDRKGSSRNDEVTAISRSLKVMADELDVAMIVLSQLTRANEKRDDPRPKLSDLRESGALEQDADVVGFLHRKNHKEGGVTNFIFEKARNGDAGTVNITLDRSIVTFTDGGEEPAPAEKTKGSTKGGSS